MIKRVGHDLDSCTQLSSGRREVLFRPERKRKRFRLESVEEGMMRESVVEEEKTLDVE